MQKMTITHKLWLDILWILSFNKPVMSTKTFTIRLILAAVLFVAVMAMLHQLSPVIKKWLTISLTFLAGLFFVLEYFWPTHMMKDSPTPGNWLTPLQDPVNDFVLYIFYWTFGLGLISLTLIHGRRLLKGASGWHNSLAFFLAMLSMIVFGYMSKIGLSGPRTGIIAYNSLFDGLLVNLDSAMFALLAFYIASAAYRAFRVRTVEAGLLMASALLVMLGLVNFGVWITSAIPVHSGWSFFRIENLSAFDMNWLNMPVQRAVTIGVGIGALGMAIRLWLSLERGSFFSQD